MQVPLLMRRLAALGYSDADLTSEENALTVVDRLVSDLIAAGQSAREVQDAAAETSAQLALANDKVKTHTFSCKTLNIVI